MRIHTTLIPAAEFRRLATFQYEMNWAEHDTTKPIEQSMWASLLGFFVIYSEAESTSLVSLEDALVK